MKKITAVLTGLLALVSVLTAQNLTGYDIMKKADERPQPATAEFTIEMSLINPKGKVRVRTISVHKKEYDSGTKQVMIFSKPADVKGVGYLSISHKDGSEDDRWLYMPALKKVRRISGSSSGDSFMGSDFSYDDMGGHQLDDYDYTLLGTETLEGRSVWKIEIIPHTKKQYSKSIAWVDQETLLYLKSEFYDKQEQQIKLLTAEDIQKESGFWVAKKMTMENVQTKHKTVIKTLQAKYNMNISDSIFRASALESGTLR
ncbi:MAG: outer membrane lipoprotein-sorting protein [Treponema sp.]